MNEGAGQERKREKQTKNKTKGEMRLYFPHILEWVFADYGHHWTPFPPYEFILSLGGVVCVRHSRQPQETKATAARSLPDLSYYNKLGRDRLCLLMQGQMCWE